VGMEVFGVTGDESDEDDELEPEDDTTISDDLRVCMESART
jgi:hypothetical protein